MSESVSPIRIINGVAYVLDDRKHHHDEIGHDATECSLEVHKNIYWVVSRKPDEKEKTVLQPSLDNVRQAFLTGEEDKPLEEWLENFGVPYRRVATMELAVLEAHAIAQEERGEPGGAGNVILTSSSDERKAQYKEMVLKLSENTEG